MIIPNIWENKIDVPNHQPVISIRYWNSHGFPRSTASRWTIAPEEPPFPAIRLEAPVARGSSGVVERTKDREPRNSGQLTNRKFGFFNGI